MRCHKCRTREAHSYLDCGKVLVLLCAYCMFRQSYPVEALKPLPHRGDGND